MRPHFIEKIEKLFAIKNESTHHKTMSNTTVNLDYIERSQPSLFIHFAYQNITEEMVSRTLDALDLGSIKEICFKPATNKKDEAGNSIAVHFDRWLRNSTSDKVRQKLISGMSININYNPKSYWKVVAFQQKSKPEPQRIVFKKPTITFDDDEDNFGPKLGVNCSEKYNTPKVKYDEAPIEAPRKIQQRPRNEQPRNEQPRNEQPRPRNEQPRPRNEPPKPRNEPKRPTTPPMPPPPTEPQAPVYKNYFIRPDAFDMSNTKIYNGVMMPAKKRTVAKKLFEQSPTTQEEPAPITPTQEPAPIIKKKNLLVDDSEDEEDSEDESDVLYGDLNK